MEPILFNTGMVRAILDGRKTVTRRAVKPQPVCYGPNITFKPHDKDFFLSAERGWLRCRVCGHYPEYSREGSDVSHHWEPPYCSGDILYVRETWYYETFYEDTDNAPDLPSGNRSWRYVYKADNLDYPVISGHWRPSIHMPQEAARIFLRVTDVRVERLQGITDEQALLEGVPKDEDYPLESSIYCPLCKGEGVIGAVHPVSLGYMDSECPNCDTPVKRFVNLWNSTIKPADRARYGWDAKPWVWVIEFERISKEKAIKSA